MRTIRISDDVWNAIAKKGKFGETPNDVLERVFKINKDMSERAKLRKKKATRPMTTPQVVGQELLVSFKDGISKKWSLPSRDDKIAIRRVRDEATTFAKQNGATPGQVDAVKKALTSAGYYLTGPHQTTK
ncbi:MAG: hypothetical protein ACE5HO_14830 [bacterium]